MRIVLSHVYGWPEVRRGAERYTHELAAALQRSGHEVRIVTTSPSPGTGVELGVPVRRLRRRQRLLRPVYGDLADQVWFGAQTLARLGPAPIDVWHAMSAADAAAAAVASRLRPGLRSVYTEVGFPARRSREARSDRRIYATVVRRVDEFVCLSQPAADLLETDYARTAQVVPAGVDLTVFRPGGSRHPTPVLLFAGDLGEPRKNLEMFLESLALLRRDRVVVEAWLVGPGRRGANLSPLAREGLAAVTVETPARPDQLPDLYRRAWATVLPSQAEVFGLVVLESLACGTPAVVLDDGLGPAGLVTDASGVKSPPTAAGLATSCQAALDLVRSAATSDRCVAVAAGYSWDAVVVPKLLRLYRRTPKP